MMTICVPLILTLVLISASQALAKPPIIILPSLLDTQLVANYDKASDPNKACTADTLTGARLWPPTLDDLAYFITTFTPVTPLPTCWWHMMQLQNTTQGGMFVSNTGVNITTSLTLGTSLVLRPLGTVIRNATGYNNSQITVLPYDWRLDVNSIQKNGQLQRVASRIIGISRRFGEKAIIIGYSQGNAVALKLLQLASVRNVVKGYIALAPPFGGAPGAIAALTSGSVDGMLPASLLKKLALPPFVPFTREQLLYKAAFGMPGFVMLSPSIAAFPDDPVVVIAGGIQYKVSQMPQLFRDIGQGQLADAYAQAQQVPITGPLPNNISTYCIYGHTLNTPRTLRYTKAFEAGIQAELPKTSAMTKGDLVVALSSLSLCDKLTTIDKVFRLPAPVSHFNVFSHPLGRAALAKALQELIN